MDKNQLRLLMEAAENARKIRENYGFDFNKIEALQLNNSQIPLLAQRITESLPKIDLSHFVKAIQFTLPKIDFLQLIPKIDYLQSLNNYHISLPKIESSLLAKIYDAQVLSLQKIASDFAQIHASDLAKIRANAFLMTSSIESIKNITQLTNTFAVELASTIYRIIENSENAEEALNDFESLVETKVSEQPNAKASLELIMFILTFLSLLAGSGQFYYSKLQYDEAKASSEINDQRYSELVGILNRITENLNKKDEKNTTNYVVRRTVELKVKPKFKSYTIAVLYPNQQVQLINSSHKWIYVEYFDYLDGIPKYGWVNKKYLINLEKSQ